MPGAATCLSCCHRHRASRNRAGQSGQEALSKPLQPSNQPDACVTAKGRESSCVFRKRIESLLRLKDKGPVWPGRETPAVAGRQGGAGQPAVLNLLRISERQCVPESPAQLHAPAPTDKSYPRGNTT